MSNPSPIMTRRRLLAVALSSTALAACSSDPLPRDTFYRLVAPATPPQRAGGPLKGVLEVPPLRASGIINERAILYREGATQLAQYSYHAWVEPPVAMVQHSLMDVLRQAQAFDNVVSPEMRLDRDYELLGTLRQWEHVRSDNTASIEIDIVVRRVRGNQQILLKTYMASEPAAGDSIDALVAAFARGLDAIFKTLIADLGSIQA
ncbi:MAG: ABC-type transport auxiliary lipoprotein family protein [Rhodospirillaceae bacterium]|nr:ABC-type transport auxiliary lipoprotein family protein [Rhodospirillaceae bacterium]